MHHDGLQLGELVTMCFYERLLIRSDVILEQKRSILSSRQVTHAITNLIFMHVQTGGDLRDIGCAVFRHLLANQQCRDRRIVVNEDAPFAVVDFAPWRQDRHLTNTILIGEAKIPLAATHLQIPETDNQNRDNQ